MQEKYKGFFFFQKVMVSYLNIYVIFPAINFYFVEKHYRVKRKRRCSLNQSVENNIRIIQNDA